MTLRLAGILLFLIGQSAPGSAPTVHADRIVVLKSAHTMTLYSGNNVLHQYKVALGRGPKGPKARQGDHKTPEGQYVIDSKNDHSRFHLALHLSYPNATDRARAARSHADAGGMVEIHGLPPSFAFVGSVQSYIDWTDGCIALSNAEIEEIWKLVPVGTKVEILP
jgi:murein L,D-transpeptidase YafK